MKAIAKAPKPLLVLRAGTLAFVSPTNWPSQYPKAFVNFMFAKNINKNS